MVCPTIPSTASQEVHHMDNKKRKPLTYKLGETESFRKFYAEYNKANKNFRRAIDGVLVTESEYQDWLARRESR